MQGGCEDKIIYRELSYKIVGILFGVYNELGYGYQEKYYERAIVESLTKAGIKFTKQASYKISFNGKIIGRYYIDLIIEDKMVLELKKGNYFSKKNIEQIKGYLKVTDLKLAILANFTFNGVKFLRVLNPNNKN